MKPKLLKVDFHLHTQEDPHDYITYDAHRLIDIMTEKGYDAIAVTNHDKFTWNQRLEDYARERGLILLRGVERTVRKRHILLINFTGELSDYRSLHDIYLSKRPDNLVIAAHPYFPMPTASGSLVDHHPEIFDALEYCHYYVKNINFNNWAVLRAKEIGKPLIGCSDSHTMRQMGRTFSLVESEKDPEAIIEAIKLGRVQVMSRPFKAATLLGISSSISLRNVRGRLKCLIKNGRYGYRGEEQED
ncbi:MAG TPA: PHP-associated domain-containing protein [Nitrospirota bacterium]|jgi:hypothetical protein